MRRAWYLALLLGFGCAGPANQTSPQADESQPDVARRPDGQASGARRVRLDAAPSRASVAPGPPTLLRSDVSRLLEAGPGALLQYVPLDPVFSGGERRRFIGFRIGRVFDNSPEVLRYGVLPGDMLRSINGQAVTTPDQLMAVFERLRNATVVQVSVLRRGQRINLSWPIVGSSPQPPAPQPTAAPPPP